MSETAREVSLVALLEVFQDGDEVGWSAEFESLWKNDAGRMAELVDSILSSGIQTPILLGPDGRVWDGHHRLAAAKLLGLKNIPVEFAFCTPNGAES